MPALPLGLFELAAAVHVAVVAMVVVPAVDRRRLA